MRTLYRIVRTNPPALEDFKSHAELGKAPHDDDPYVRRLAQGVSVFATLAQARRNARIFPSLGAFVAEIAIPDEATCTAERSGRHPGHHTLWASPADLLRWVVAVHSVT